MRSQEAAKDEQAVEMPARRKKRPFGNRSEHDIVRDMFLALTLCHNVTPVYPDEDDPTVKDYQASSPDEIALVKFSEEMGMHLVEREEEYIKLLTPQGAEDEYDILQNFPFSSDTKRMGIIVRHRGSGKIVFYVKGADTVMSKKVKPG